MNTENGKAVDEILKVDNATVAFGAFKALNALTFSLGARRTARRHRTERRRQNDAPRLDHRQDSTYIRQGLVSANQPPAHRRDAASRPTDRLHGRRPQISDAQCLQRA